MNICSKLFKCSYLDLEFLENLVESLETYTDFTFDDVIEGVKGLGFNDVDINYYIYETLYLNALAIKDECIKYFPNLENDIHNLEEDINCNYLDSFYDSPFDKWDWEEYMNCKDKKEYIQNFLKNFDLEVQND